MIGFRPRIYKDVQGEYPEIIQLIESESYVEHLVSYDEASRVSGFGLFILARKYLGSDRAWTILADVNLPKHPALWQNGDIIRIPISSQRSEVGE